LGRVQPGELDRRFVRFRAGVTEKSFAAEASLRQKLSPSPLGFGVPRIRHMNQLSGLPLNRLNHPRRAMSQQIAAPTGEEIEIPPPLVVPNVRAFTALQTQREPSVIRYH